MPSRRFPPQKLSSKVVPPGAPAGGGTGLEGGASRGASKARAGEAGRGARSEGALGGPARQSDGVAQGDDLGQVLDEEVGRLPDKFRAPLVFCYLQGLTREEA